LSDVVVRRENSAWTGIYGYSIRQNRGEILVTSEKIFRIFLNQKKLKKTLFNALKLFGFHVLKFSFVQNWSSMTTGQ
jgi:hypothetical protein